VNLTLAIASVGAAIATVAAVILALYLQIYLVRSRRPVLSLSVSLDPNDEDVVALISPESCGLWIRVRVSARSGRSTAKNVRVRLMQATRPSAGKNIPPVPAREFSWADSSESHVEIPAASWRRFDFLRYWVELRGEKRRILLPVFQHHRSPFPHNERHWLNDPGMYRLVLSLTADDIDATVWEISFIHAPDTSGAETDLLSSITQLECRKIRLYSPGTQP
jgi:hypothetical protein